MREREPRAPHRPVPRSPPAQGGEGGGGRTLSATELISLGSLRFCEQRGCTASAVRCSTMAGMAKRPLSLRIDEGLLARVDRVRGDVSRTRWVVRALESALGDSSTAEQPRRREPNSRVAGSTPARPAPSRASGDFFDAAAVALERQARLNKAKGS